MSFIPHTVLVESCLRTQNFRTWYTLYLNRAYCTIPLPTMPLPPRPGPSLSNISLSLREPTFFTAPCPYCQKQIKVEVDPTLGGPTGGCTKTGGFSKTTTCRCPYCAPDNFLSSACPLCYASITMKMKQNQRVYISLELVQPAPWCRFRLADPQRDLGQPGQPSKPSLMDQTNYVPQYPYVELLKQNGYLPAKQCYSIQGQRWNGNLYWERSCPHCKRATQIKFSPLPSSITLEAPGEITATEYDSLETFLNDLCGQPVQDLISCPHCETQLFIELCFIEGSGGLYMAEWSVLPPSHHFQPKRLKFGNGVEFFNQFAIAPPGYNLDWSFLEY